MSLASFWSSAGPWKKGFAVSSALLGAVALYTFLTALLPYDGRCGSGMLFSARQPCSFGDRAAEALNWTFLMLLLFWPVALIALFVPPVVFVIRKRLRKS